MNKPLDVAQNLARVLSGDMPSTPFTAEQWDALYEVAAAQWLAGSLGLAIQTLPDEFKPPQQALIEFTFEVAEFQKRREKDLQNNIAFINEALKDYGPVLWLKGADDLLQGISKPSGTRWMMDLDCLVALPKFKPAWDQLLNHHYHLLEDGAFSFFHWDSEIWHHAPNIVRKDDNIAIELHRYVGRFNTRDILPEDTCLENAIDVQDIKQNTCRVLNPNDGLIHRILHMQIMDEIEQKNILSIRHAYHLYLYINQHHKNIDWLLVQHKMQSFGYGDTLKRVIYFMNWLFQLEPPLFDANCSIGKDFLNRVNQQHSKSRWGKMTKPLRIIGRGLAAFLSPKRVPKTYGRKPNGLFDWVKAYLHRFYLALKMVASPGGIKKLFAIYQSEDW